MLIGIHTSTSILIYLEILQRCQKAGHSQAQDISILAFLENALALIPASFSTVCDLAETEFPCHQEKTLGMPGFLLSDPRILRTTPFNRFCNLAWQVTLK